MKRKPWEQPEGKRHVQKNKIRMTADFLSEMRQARLEQYL